MKILITIIFLYNISLLPQVVTVKDNSTRNPLELVSIYNSDPNRSILTNSSGKADISRLDKSKKIIFRIIGYEKLELNYDEIERNEFEIFMKATTISLDNVVVTTNRWEENKSNIPNTIKVVTPRDVDFQNPQTTADMLGMSGNVFIQKSQLGGGSPMIRG